MAFQEKGPRELRELGSTDSPSKKARRDVGPRRSWETVSRKHSLNSSALL